MEVALGSWFNPVESICIVELFIAFTCKYVVRVFSASDNVRCGQFAEMLALPAGNNRSMTSDDRIHTAGTGWPPLRLSMMIT